MFRWLPFVSRERFEELKETARQRLEDVSREKDAAIAIRDARIVTLEAEAHRMLDLIFRNNFGVQLHDTLPNVPDQAEPEPEQTEEQRAEQEILEQHAEEIDRIKSLMRTSPSRVGPAMQQMLAIHEVRAARNAHPATVVFSHARDEVMAK